MSHRVVQQHWEIKKGTTIEYNPSPSYPNEIVPRVIAECVGRENGCLRIRHRANEVTRMIPEEWYVCSLLISSDLRNACIVYRKTLTEQGLSNHTVNTHMQLFITAWTLCERMYGIDAEGSKPTDRRREVAFAILKGDPMALDMASDVLGK